MPFESLSVLTLKPLFALEGEEIDGFPLHHLGAYMLAAFLNRLRAGRLTRGLIVVGLLMWGLGGGEVCAQSGLKSVESVSTGGGTSALSGGVAGLYANPAFLTVGEAKHRVEVQLVRVGASSGGDLFQFGPYRTLFTRGNQESLSDADEVAVLDDWFGASMRTATSELEVVPVAMTYRSPGGQWAVGGSVRARVVQQTALDRGVLDLMLRGTEPERTVPLNGRTHLYNTVDVTGSFSYRFSGGPLSVGVSPRLILGTGYADGVLESEVEVEEGALTHRFDYTARAAGPLSTGLYDSFDAFSAEPVQQVLGTTSGVAGLGGGLDVGVSYAMHPGLHVSASITDLGMIRWTDGAQTVTPTHDTFQFEGISVDATRLREEFGGNLGAYVEHQVDSLARVAYRDVERERAPFQTSLPTVAHVSSTWASGPVTVNGGLSMGLSEVPEAVSRSLTLHAGGEVSVGPVPMRAGVRLLGTQALTVAGGLGLEVGTYRLDVGGSLTPKTSLLGRGARYAVSLSLGTVQI